MDEEDTRYQRIYSKEKEAGGRAFHQWQSLEGDEEEEEERGTGRHRRLSLEEERGKGRRKVGNDCFCPLTRRRGGTDAKGGRGDGPKTD